MEAIIITKQELESFKKDIIHEITKLVNEKTGEEIKPWLRTRDVCKLLNLSTSSLQNLRNEGKIPFTKLNGAILYRKEDIEKMLEELMKGKGN